MVRFLICCCMPRTKKTQTESVVPSEPIKRRTAAVPATSAVKHKHTTKKPVPLTVDSATPTKVVKQEDIAKLAYSYWVARDGKGGSPQTDWFRAEQELEG